MSSFWFDPMVQTVGMPGYGGGPQINTDYGGQLAQQQAYVAAQNQAAMAAAASMGPGYGQISLPYLSGSFGEAAAPGTYSPGSGLSSFSGSSLGGGGYPAGQVEYGGPMSDIPYQNPFGGGGGGGWQMGADGQSRYTDPWSQGAPSSGVVAGWYDPYGGGGGYPMQQPAAPQMPVQSQDWQSTFNNMTAGNNSAAYPLGDSSWYPSQRQPAPDFSDIWGSRSMPVMNGGGDFWSNYNAASAAAAATTAGGGYRDPGNIDRYRGGEAYGQPSANPSYFDPGTYYGPGGGGGYDPWRSAALPAYDPNSFANRFAAGGYYNPGTPSQYTSQTYRDAGGIAYPPNIPGGFNQGYQGVPLDTLNGQDLGIPFNFLGDAARGGGGA